MNGDLRLLSEHSPAAHPERRAEDGAVDLPTAEHGRIQGPERTGVDVLLADGSVARIREFRPTDRDAVIQLHDAASDTSIHNRFFSASRDAPRHYVDHLCEAGPEQTLALIAELDHQVVALATSETIRPNTSEVSFFVADNLNGKGVATLLLEHLAAVARRQGRTRFVAEVKAANYAMSRVLKDAGFDLSEKVDGGMLHFEMSTTATERALAEADARECAAEARSLWALRHPAVVAVAGVRRDGTGVGRAVLDSIREGGYTGHLVVLHPTAPEMDGVPAFPSLAAMPLPVDLLIAAVPAARMLDLVHEAGAAGVKCTVILTADFAEAGASGSDRQHALVAAARSHGMRLIGPNCFGVGSFSADIHLNATFGRSAPLTGGLAVASQSGGVGIALQDAARAAGLGLAAFVSLGNKCDVSGNDLLAAWMDDPEITVAALYLESFGNPRKFARFARRFSERKPLLAMVGGQSAEGGRAGASHTAAAATPATAVQAVFTQAGVIPVSDTDELVQAAQFLAGGRLPAGQRLGILGNAGGLGILAADAAVADGLAVPMLSENLRTRLASVLGTVPGSSNPVDLGAAAGPESFATAARLLLHSDQIDSLLVVFAATRVGDTAAVVSAVRHAASRSDLPVALVVHGDTAPPAADDEWDVPVLASVEAATRAISHATHYATWRNTPKASAPPAEADESTHQVVTALLADQHHGGWLTASAAQTLLATHGITAPTGTVAIDTPIALAAAEEVGYPVAVKIADPEVLHKTDRKLVVVGVGSRSELVDVIDSFRRILGKEDVSVLIQPVITGGLELAVGMVRDATFGPVIMVAAGGVAIDVWADRAFLVPPVSDLDVARAIRSLRIAPLLDGLRGAPACDVSAVENVVRAVARLAEDVPELAEMDLNPVVAGPHGVACVDVRIRLASPTTPESGLSRQLSPA